MSGAEGQNDDVHTCTDSSADGFYMQAGVKGTKSVGPLAAPSSLLPSPHSYSGTLTSELRPSR